MRYLLLFLILCSSFNLLAQSGGGGTFKFLDLPASARSASMGGQLISVKDGDINLVHDNPALLDSNMDQNASMTYVGYLADINFGYGTYAKHFDGLGTFSAGMQYINYGTFQRADEYGVRNGEFSAGEYALDVTYGYTVNRLWSMGASAKMIYSSFDGYNSFGAALDLGAHYQSFNELFSAGLVLNNIGYQIKPYVSGNRENLPFEAQLAASYRLPKAPIRFTLHTGHLQRPNLMYDKPAEGQPFIQPNGAVRSEPAEAGGFSLENFMRHTTLNAEILPSEHFHIRIGFNYMRRSELAATANSSGLAGFSLGTGFRVKKFNFNYGLAAYHLAGFSHHITLSTNFNEFKRKS